jgi:CHAD domain-containing protein
MYQPGELGQFINQLKRLQDNLGVFNDLSVQLDELKRYLDRSGGGVPVDTAVAVGALIARLEDRQRSVRGAFAESFAAFAGRDNAKRFESLFGGSGGRAD